MPDVFPICDESQAPGFHFEPWYIYFWQLDGKIFVSWEDLTQVTVFSQGGVFTLN